MGLPGPPAASLGSRLVRHSQSSDRAVCPNNMTPLWSGYSILRVESVWQSLHQDLGNIKSNSITVNKGNCEGLFGNKFIRLFYLYLVSCCL